MLDLAALRTRLDTECPSLNRVRVAADFEGVLALLACNPAEGFVGNYTVSNGENLSLSGTLQDSTESFSVWIAVRRTTSATVGEAWQSNLTTPVAEVCAALVDYQPAELDMPIYRVGASLEQVTRYLAYWRIDFAGRSFESNCL
jgi:hypothetical protein